MAISRSREPIRCQQALANANANQLPWRSCEERNVKREGGIGEGSRISGEGVC